MRQIKEVLRLKYAAGCTHRQISAAVGMSKSSVSGYVKRAGEQRISWEVSQSMTDAELESRLFSLPDRNLPLPRAPIDMQWVHRELKRTGVTLQLLWLEYQQGVTSKHDGTRAYQYSQFCELYRTFVKRLHPSMRQVHRAGEKAFVDYSGKKPVIVDPATGEVIDVELFVIVLGASNYTYAEATRTQTLPDFIGSHVRAFDYFGCVPALTVPDQLRSAVAHPDRYDPGLNATYIEMAQHYGIGIIPARPRKPKDKAKVEAGVLVAQRWIMARLRNRTFFSLEELNDAIAELLEELNTRAFQKLEGCRRSAFESIDRPAMKALPLTRYELAQWKECGVNIDYHVECQDRLYSVPCALIGQRVEIRWTSSAVEVFHAGQRVACHQRSYGPKGTAITCEQHRPKSHREYGQWPPERLVAWAASIGQQTGEVVREILARVPHPEMGYRSCLALIRISKRYGAERTEAACRKALDIGAPSRRTVEMILKNGLERDGASDEPAAKPVVHENIRGGTYFDRSEQNPGTGKVSAQANMPIAQSQEHGARTATSQCRLAFERAASAPQTAASPSAAPAENARAQQEGQSKVPETNLMLFRRNGNGYTH
jgi:transposase